MECNREEALRAKELAEKKFMAKDIGGAKKFALKAQNLFPSLEGISQMLATLDVYLCSDPRYNGEKDWYAVLSVNPLADDETVRKQYRKLALQLHPDKNKSIGAEGAFQLISEAWSVLSDKNKRMSYDQKRGGKGYQPMAKPPSKKDNSVPNSANGFFTFANNAASKVRSQKKSNTAMPPPSSKPVPQPSQVLKSETFWTSCNRCKMQYEYLRVYLNHNLLCPNCREPFLAAETGAPTSVPNNSSSQSSSQKCQPSSSHKSATKNANGASAFPRMESSGSQLGVDPNLLNRTNFQWGPFSRTAGAASATASPAAAFQAANVVHHTFEKVRREREEAQAAARKEAIIHRRSKVLKKGASTSGDPNAGLDGSVNFPKVDRHAKRKRGDGDDAGVGDTASAGMDPGNSFKFRATPRQLNIRKGFLQMDIRNRLLGIGKGELHKMMVQDWTAAAAIKSAEKEDVKKVLKESEEKENVKKKQKESADKENVKKKQKVKDSVNEKLKEPVHANATNQDGMNQLSNSKQASAKKEFVDAWDADADPANEVKEPVSIDVPDPDFHDFDKDRTERSFQGDQIWATYDDEDGMPRYYAFIQKVISCKPFKVRMSFLASKSNSEFGPLNWVASGFAKTAGDFRVGRYDVIDTLNIFSHRVRWEKGPRGVIKILPRKGEIWALYRNWSSDWDEHTPDEVMYKYDMVEILEDYNEKEGVSVTPLVKVPGFKTVFRRHPDPGEVKRIQREEMFRLSHQVPSYILTGEEGHNAPKGCCELDPAATPLELLQVVIETKDAEDMEAAEDEQGQQDQQGQQGQQGQQEQQEQQQAGS